MEYSGAGGKLIHEKNQKQKILWHCPFKLHGTSKGGNTRYLLIWTYPEMEFLVEVSRHKLESSQAQVFVWFSTPIFPFYKVLFMNRLEFFLFRRFFVRI